MVVCSGEDDKFMEVQTMISQTRHRMNSTLPIVVAHCNELKDVSISWLLAVRDVQVLNLCGEFAALSDRLHGFFCKTAALIASPFEQTMLVDSDVIWFQKPELLFEAPDFVATGTLFFRDRWTQTKNKLTLTKGRHSADALAAYIRMLAHREHRESSSLSESNNNNNKGNAGNKRRRMQAAQQTSSSTNSNSQLLQQMRSRKKVDHMGNLTAHAEKNAYWRHLVFGKGLTLDHMQESSVLLLDAPSHPRMLSILRKILPDFNQGYGDKECYWIAATASGEPFAFEPHVAGSLGDCGAVVHFDPRVPKEDVGGATSSFVAAPFFTNAEYLLDLGKISLEGDFLDSSLSSQQDSRDAKKKGKSNPLITTAVRFHEATSPVTALMVWKNMKHGFYPCGNCELFKCVEAPQALLDEITQSQRQILSLKAKAKKNQV